MKKINLLFWLVISSTAIGQNFSENFEVKNFVTVFSNDSIAFYFDNSGTIVEKSRAQYYRKGKIDSININVNGTFVDYYKNRKVALTATMKNDFLDGVAIYYFDNGQVKAKGEYRNGVKTGKWQYYYRSGKLRHIFNYNNEYPIVEESFTKQGKKTVNKGNGIFTGDITPKNSSKMFKIKGEILNGKMNGKWKMYDQVEIGEEFFENGHFIKGVSMNLDYYDFPRINLLDYIPNETVSLYDNFWGWSFNKYNPFKKNANRDFPFKYLRITLDSLSSNSTNSKNQWILVSINMKKEKKKENFIIKSSINDTIIEENLYNILKSLPSEFNPYSPPKDSGLDYFFTIILKDNVFIIPREYLIRQQLNK